jgi:glycine cleavage system regulatory protein
MARIAGRFAGILQVAVDPAKAAALTAALEKLGPSGLRVIVEDSVDAAEPQGQAYWIELMGSDQPNIVRDISKALASRDVTVLELTSEVSDAPVAGGRLFKLQASIRCPESLSREELRESLEELANSLMVDIQLDD